MLHRNFLMFLFLWVWWSIGLQAQPAADEPADDNAASGLVEKRTAPAEKTAGKTGEANRVDWRAMGSQAVIFSGLQHAFRLGTEPGTRDGMRGHFLGGYTESVASLHGWGDGDPFLVNYVGHPMQGAVSGFIYVQNDPQARMIRAGRDPRYWRSRLKAMGAAWAYSTLFEIGPLSEASIGKIQAKRPQQGLVDHVVTPLVGAGWLIAEDFLDEKIVLPFERRFENRWARMMVRGWLNPTRSFSNMLRMQAPWYRDTRGGIMKGHYREPLVNPREESRQFPKAATLELAAIPTWTRFDGTQCAGGGGQVAYRLAPSWQLVGQVNGCQLRDLAANSGADSLTYAIGPRWTPMAERRVNAYAQVLVGGSKLTRYETDVAREAVLKAEAKLKKLEAPAQELYTRTDVGHGMALLAGTGIDVRLNPAFALRLASVEYNRSWAGASMGTMDAKPYNHGLQLSSGVILRMGTW